MARTSSTPKTGPTAVAQQEQVTEGIEKFELPRALVTKIAKSAIGNDAKLQKETVLSLVKGSTVFINYLGATAHDVALSKQHKSISASDVIKALELMDFDEAFRKIIQDELVAYRDLPKTDKGKKGGASASAVAGSSKAKASASTAARGSVSAPGPAGPSITIPAKGKGKGKAKTPANADTASSASVSLARDDDAMDVDVEPADEAPGDEDEDDEMIEEEDDDEELEEEELVDTVALEEEELQRDARGLEDSISARNIPDDI
ncbi:hypothetical protein HGRIS_010841 [Hohenbuehelia grisea]|uniref:DNA polymerase epsilon subunit D n=1 Tax=Hohenbuehelia grisea TaxID=104357 RepID=A0ABR3IY61_9AGAR